MNTYTPNSLLVAAFRELADELPAFQGIEDSDAEARIADLRVNGADACLIIDDNGLEVHRITEGGETSCWGYHPEGGRDAATECLANLIVGRATGVIGISGRELESLGLERVC